MTVVWRIWHDDDETHSCDKHFWLFPRRIVVLFIRLFRKLSDERFVGVPLWAFNCEVLCVMEMWRQPDEVSLLSAVARVPENQIHFECMTDEVLDLIKKVM